MNPIPIRPLPTLAPAALRSPLPARWRVSWLFAAPHRLGFFAASLMLATSSLWWAAMLLARAFGVAPAWAVSAPAAHALLMCFGFMPLFIAGFLFTAGPKWLGLPEVAARSLRVPVLLMLVGWAVTLTGVHLSALLAAAGIALVAGGWTALCLKFVALLRRSPVPDRVHATLVAAACGVGALALWTAALSLLIGSELLLRSATQVGLWCFAASVFAVVSHRMIPFFSASALPLLDAWRPMWLLWVMVAVLWLQAPLAVAELWAWPLPGALRWAQVAVDAPAAVLLLWLALRWGLVQSLKIRLLAMLHGGFLWLGIALALFALSNALMALTADQVSLGLAPLHAMTMGYLGATLFAMATRVSSGHGGRPLAADNIAWLLYWVLQTAVVLRVIAALWPALTLPITLLAVLVWSVATVGWALRYGSWFGRPRADNRPG
ncbi:NnrS family protein [Piscinibacter sp.]|jgi:uncharacterized protein involved in response to NO|uniref:NnrS family protein n=1 Tax=Piscinibacter sp. TaxID=1903157 RepID=UPI003559796A